MVNPDARIAQGSNGQEHIFHRRGTILNLKSVSFINCFRIFVEDTGDKGRGPAFLEMGRWSILPSGLRKMGDV
jgi:hypothetical protein